MRLKSIQIQTTSACNAVCAMCPHPTSWMKTKQGRGRMTDELYEKIIMDLKEQNFDGQFIPYLGNEPFMDPTILDKIDFAIGHMPTVKLTVDSNMAMLNEDKIDRLYELYEKVGFRGKFTISHHGIDKETIWAITGIPYDKSLNNLVYLIKKFNNKLPIIIHSCCDWMDSDLDLDGVFKDSESGKKKFTRDAFEKVKWPGVKKYWHGLIQKYDLPTKTLKLDRLVPNSKANRAPVRSVANPGRGSCPRIRGFFHVLWNGEATLCCRTVYRHEADIILGDLNNQTIQEVYASEKCHIAYERVRGNIKSREDHPCKRC